jgi:hypothetical protein
MQQRCQLNPPSMLHPDASEAFGSQLVEGLRGWIFSLVDMYICVIKKTTYDHMFVSMNMSLI